MDKGDIGIYGLGTMGQNLALNFANHGFSVAVFNRKEGKERKVVSDFIAGKGVGKKIYGAVDLADFINYLKRPRKIMVMVKAGAPVDAVIEQFIPLLSAGDVIIDGGNSHYADTLRRLTSLESRKILFVGCGISGGSQGALKGPALMPSGSSTAWKKIKPMFEAIAAKNDKGKPCCVWFGPQGSGHFIKMVHNAIEYALMQLLAESYDTMKRMLALSNEEITKVVLEWNEGVLRSYLLAITGDILKMKDSDGSWLVDNILDFAEQKGTGKDISIIAIELGVPAITLSVAVNARFISGEVKIRRLIAKRFTGSRQFRGNKNELLQALAHGLYCSQLIVYAQGFSLIAAASARHSWNINSVKIAQIWENSSIIRSRLLSDIARVFEKKPAVDILLNPYFRKIIKQKQTNWRYAVANALEYGIPVPALSSALTYFDSFRSECLPANLIQAQRDYFGAHGFKRRKARPESLFHIKKSNNNETT